MSQGQLLRRIERGLDLRGHTKYTVIASWQGNTEMELRKWLRIENTWWWWRRRRRRRRRRLLCKGPGDVGQSKHGESLALKRMSPSRNVRCWCLFVSFSTYAVTVRHNIVISSVSGTCEEILVALQVFKFCVTILKRSTIICGLLNCCTRRHTYNIAHVFFLLLNDVTLQWLGCHRYNIIHRLIL